MNKAKLLNLIDDIEAENNICRRAMFIEYAKTLTADEIKELSGELMDIWQVKEFGEEWAKSQ